MTNELLTHIKKYAPFVFLDRDDADDEALGRSLAEFTMNWARLDYELYRVLRVKDHKKAVDWMQVLLAPHLLGQRIEVVRNELAEIADGDDDFGRLLKNCFDRIDELRKKRNLLVHGLWYRENREIFRITPMQLDAGNFVPPVQVKRSEIREFVVEMQTVIKMLSHLRGNTRSRVARSKGLQPGKKASLKS